MGPALAATAGQSVANVGLPLNIARQHGGEQRQPSATALSSRRAAAVPETSHHFAVLPSRLPLPLQLPLPLP